MIRAKPVMLMREIPKNILKSLEDRGLYRCGVIFPQCPEPPYAQIQRSHEKRSDPTIPPYSIFCLYHARLYAARNGHAFPEPKDGGGIHRDHEGPGGQDIP